MPHLPRLCNYCLGASGTSAWNVRHPTVSAKKGFDTHVEAFVHSGRSCPHMKLHQRIWTEKSHEFYHSITNLIKSAGFGPGALIEVAFPAGMTGDSRTSHAIITSLDFDSPMLYGLGVSRNGALRVEGDFYGMAYENRLSLYLDCILDNQPDSPEVVVGTGPGVFGKRRQFLEAKLPQIQNGNYHFGTWHNKFSTRYGFNKPFQHSIKVLVPAPLEIPEPLFQIDYDRLVKKVREEGRRKSKNVRDFHYDYFRNSP